MRWKYIAVEGPIGVGKTTFVNLMAVKLGATDYLAKPADADQVEAALLENDDGLPPPPELPMSADRVRWEHIQRIYQQCDQNVSQTA